MQAETLLSLPDGLVIIDGSFTDDTLGLVIASVSPYAACPICGTKSVAQHSFYQRTCRDVPCGGVPVRILLQTRRFFCCQSTCPRQIFTERFPSFVLPRARMTERFREALLALSVAI